MNPNVSSTATAAAHVGVLGDAGFRILLVRRPLLLLVENV